VYFGPAFNLTLLHFGNTMKDRNTFQTVLPAPLKSTFARKLSSFLRVQFWPKEEQTIYLGLFIILPFNCVPKIILHNRSTETRHNIRNTSG
jgi:hypothetical protein